MKLILIILTLVLSSSSIFADEALIEDYPGCKNMFHNKSNTGNIINNPYQAYEIPEIEKKKEKNYYNYQVLDLQTGFYSATNSLQTETISNNGLTLDTYNDYYFSKDSYELAIFSGINFSYLKKPIYNEAREKNLEMDKEITLQELRIKYRKDNLSMTLGILPLYRGSTFKYDSFDFSRADGSNYISSLILQGGTISYRFTKDDPLFITLGKGYYEKIKINSIELHDKAIKGSDETFLFIKKKKNLEHDNYLEWNMELSEINYKYNNTLAFSQDILGNTFSYKRDDHLLWLFYGYQRGEGDNTGIVRQKLSIPLFVPNSAIYTNTDSTFIGPYKNSGSALAIGYRYNFDLFQKENYILYEHYRTYNDWVSPNVGEPFSEYGLSRLGSQHKISYGFFQNKELLYKLTYVDFNMEKKYKLGGSMQTGDAQNIDPTSKKRSQSLYLSIQYIF